MKGSVSFDLNNAKFTQNIPEFKGRVNSYIRLKLVRNWLKKSLKMGLFLMKLRIKMLEMGQNFSVEFSRITRRLHVARAFSSLKQILEKHGGFFFLSFFISFFLSFFINLFLSLSFVLFLSLFSIFTSFLWHRLWHVINSASRSQLSPMPLKIT